VLQWLLITNGVTVISPNPIQPNPWINPIHVQLWLLSLLAFVRGREIAWPPQAEASSRTNAQRPLVLSQLLVVRTSRRRRAAGCRELTRRCWWVAHIRLRRGSSTVRTSSGSGRCVTARQVVQHTFLLVDSLTTTTTTTTTNNNNNKTLGHYTAFQFGLSTWELCFCRWGTGPLTLPTFDFSFTFLALWIFTTEGEKSETKQKK